MKILIPGLAFGLLLLAVPLYIMYRFRLNVIDRWLSAFGRMVAVVALLAITAYYAAALSSIVVDLLYGLLLCVAATVLSLRKAATGNKRLFLPLLGGNVLATALVAAFTLFAVMTVAKPIPHLLLIAVVGLLTCGSAMANAKALESFYSGLRNHGQLYYYILGNGGSHSRAVAFFIRRSLQTVVVTVGKATRDVFFLTAPLLFFALLAVDTDVLTAAVLTVVLPVLALTTSLASVLFTLVVGRSYCFDSYERLRVKVQPSPAAASSSSASPSELPHTDSESQPQE